MQENIRLAVATYTNTIPFLWGITHSEYLKSHGDLIQTYPSACAELVINKKADIGIIPVQALLDIPNYEILTNYCIGADGAVDSVFIFSNVPAEDIRTLRLDIQSKTSNGLAQILLRQYWKANFVITESPDADAYVLIGDRTFGKKNESQYVYDMAEYWKKMTGLPFAFAVWGANRKLSDEFEVALDMALKTGVENIPELLRTLPEVPNFDLNDYLGKKLDFNLTDRKREAISLYHELYRSLLG